MLKKTFNIFSNKHRFLKACALLFFVSSTSYSADWVDASAETERAYQERPEVIEFVNHMVAQHSFKREELLEVFANAKFQPSVVKAMDPPASAGVRSWQRYRPRFINPVRIKRGQQFMAQYASELKRARETYGVPEEIVASIIGVETVYGQNTGKYRIVDALTTLAFDYPRRAEYFKGELEQFFLFAREQEIPYFSVLGSYAGAIGLPQFMPTNIRQLAVDFDGDGKIDLRNSPIDAIGSVARYFQFYGWQTGEPIAVPVNFKDAVPEEWTESILPALTTEDFKNLKYSTERAFDNKLNFALIPLATPNQAPDYWLGFNNFYVITRYNQSSFYAMSVMQLAEELKR